MNTSYFSKDHDYHQREGLNHIINISNLADSLSSNMSRLSFESKTQILKNKLDRLNSLVSRNMTSNKSNKYEEFLTSGLSTATHASSPMINFSCCNYKRNEISPETQSSSFKLHSNLENLHDKLTVMTLKRSNCMNISNDSFSCTNHKTLGCALCNNNLKRYTNAWSTEIVGDHAKAAENSAYIIGRQNTQIIRTQENSHIKSRMKTYNIYSELSQQSSSRKESNILLIERFGISLSSSKINTNSVTKENSLTMTCTKESNSKPLESTEPQTLSCYHSKKVGYLCKQKTSPFNLNPQKSKGKNLDEIFSNEQSICNENDIKNIDIELCQLETDPGPNNKKNTNATQTICLRKENINDSSIILNVTNQCFASNNNTKEEKGASIEQVNNVSFAFNQKLSNSKIQKHRISSASIASNESFSSKHLNSPRLSRQGKSKDSISEKSEDNGKVIIEEQNSSIEQKQILNQQFEVISRVGTPSCIIIPLLPIKSPSNLNNSKVSYDLATDSDKQVIPKSKKRRVMISENYTKMEFDETAKPKHYLLFDNEKKEIKAQKFNLAEYMKSNKSSSDIRSILRYSSQLGSQRQKEQNNLKQALSSKSNTQKIQLDNKSMSRSNSSSKAFKLVSNAQQVGESLIDSNRREIINRARELKNKNVILRNSSSNSKSRSRSKSREPYCEKFLNNPKKFFTAAPEKIELIAMDLPID